MEAELSNATIAGRLLAYAALLELAEANAYAARAYRRASDVVRASPVSVAELVRSGRVRELRGIGAGIEARLRELVETGDIAELRDLEAELRPELIGFGRLLGLGPRRVLEIARALDVGTADELRSAVEQGRLLAVPGVGPVTEARIRAALLEKPSVRRGLTLDRSRPLVEGVAQALDGHVAGDVCRFCELAYDLAVVVGAEDPRPVLDRFGELPQIVAVLERQERRATGVTVEGVPVRAVVAEPTRLGTELVRATGSAAYVAGLEPLPAGTTEEVVFRRLGRAWRPPELREVPEVEVPLELVQVAHLRGDLHCHSDWSDGRATVEEMGRAARDRGHAYLAICDHTVAVRVVPGLDADGVRRQGEHIRLANEKLAPFRILRGIECDIRPDGSLDLADDVLSELDWVQASLHAGQRRSAGELTRIVCEALRNPSVSALSHPKGRLLNRRPENALDLDEVYATALEAGVALEINGLPDRLDLSSAHAAEALRAGVELVLSSDAHSVRGLENIELAVATARRAGASVQSIVNARTLEEVLARRARP